MFDLLSSLRVNLYIVTQNFRFLVCDNDYHCFGIEYSHKMFFHLFKKSRQAWNSGCVRYAVLRDIARAPNKLAIRGHFRLFKINFLIREFRLSSSD